MDMQKIAGEIGLFEVGINLSRVCGSCDVLHTVGASMPLPDEDIADQVTLLGKETYAGECRNMVQGVFLKPVVLY